MNERMSKKKEKHEKHFRVYGYLKIIVSALLSIYWKWKGRLGEFSHHQRDDFNQIQSKWIELKVVIAKSFRSFFLIRSYHQVKMNDTQYLFFFYHPHSNWFTCTSETTTGAVRNGKIECPKPFSYTHTHAHNTHKVFWRFPLLSHVWGIWRVS